MSQNAAGPLLCVDDLTVTFGGVSALRNVSFTAREGDLLAIIGPNGAGKTTLFNCLSAIQRPDTGSVRCSGRDIVGASPKILSELRIGRTFQNLGLFERLDPVENILLGRHSLMRCGFFGAAFQLPWAVAEERRHKLAALETARMLGLERYLGRSCATLPYGVRKLVEFGRALAMEPRLIMLDEPVAGMNREETEEMAEHIQKIRARYGTTVLLVEHDMGLVMDIADQVVVLDFGEVIAVGPPRSVQTHPKVIEAYLGVQA